MTTWEEKVLNLAVALRDAKFSVEEAVIRQSFWHAVDMVKKERRDAKAETVVKSEVSEDNQR